MPAILIAGGAGFLGSHLCDRFWEEGFDVICVDNLVTGARSNMAHLAGRARFTYIQHDITEPLRLSCHLDDILNFASPASPPDYLRLPIQTLKVGAVGTYHLLELAKEKSAIFMMASTSEVYGDPLVAPQNEAYWGNVNPIGPRSVYDESKRFAEAITMAYHRHHGLDVRTLRIFNTYGPRMQPNDGRAIPNFISQALNNEPLTVYGDGSQTRSFCYVSDEIEGIYRLLMSNLHEPVNIGNPNNEMTMLELAKTIRELTGASSEIVFKTLPKDDPKIRCPDITRARALLGWEPHVSLEEGLRHTIEYFRVLKSQGKL
ncbi:SDR family oxidoreductase [Candidatus Poribacteria bacterium]|nr:SDR family oxidoreductase [Candidatus Poribacteria bacterium]